MIRRIMAFVFCAVALLNLLLMAACKGDDPGGKMRLGFLLFAEHSAIDASYTGFLEYVKQHPEIYGADPTIEVRNAEGDMAKLDTYVTYFSTEPFNLICVLGTPAAKLFAERNTLNKTVFAAPPDAKQAGIIQNVKEPGGLVTGVTFRPPAGLIVESIRRALPSAKIVGVPHNPAEPNSRLVVDDFEKQAKQKNLTVRRVPVHDSSEVASAAEFLASSSDVIFAPNDNTVQGAFETVVQRANERKIPVVSVDRGTVEKGAIFSIGGDYVEVGRVTAQLGAKLLQGADPAKTPVIEASSASRMYINSAVAESLGVQLPPAMLRKAEMVK